MIQRKQTIYFGLAFICVLLLLFFPIFSISAEEMGQTISGEFGSNGMTGEGYQQDMPVYLIYVTLALFSAMSIALFKNRKRQLLVARLGMILHILVAFAFSIFYYVGRNTVTDELLAKGFDNVAFDLGIGFYFLVATIPFYILGNRGVKQDEELLKSIDRIR